MSPRLKEKDTDPHGLKASMDLVMTIAELNPDDIIMMPIVLLRALKRKASLIRKKFRDKGERP